MQRVLVSSAASTGSFCLGCSYAFVHALAHAFGYRLCSGRTVCPAFSLCYRALARPTKFIILVSILPLYSRVLSRSDDEWSPCRAMPFTSFVAYLFLGAFPTLSSFSCLTLSHRHLRQPIWNHFYHFRKPFYTIFWSGVNSSICAVWFHNISTYRAAAWNCSIPQPTCTDP